MISISHWGVFDVPSISRAVQLVQQAGITELNHILSEFNNEAWRDFRAGNSHLGFVRVSGRTIGELEDENFD